MIRSLGSFSDLKEIINAADTTQQQQEETERVASGGYVDGSNVRLESRELSTSKDAAISSTSNNNNSSVSSTQPLLSISNTTGTQMHTGKKQEDEKINKKDTSEAFIEMWKTLDGKFDKESKLREIHVLVAQGLVSQDVYDRLLKLTTFEQIKKEKQQKDKEVEKKSLGQRMMHKMQNLLDRGNAKIQEVFHEHILKGGVDLSRKDEKPVIEGLLFKRAVDSGKNWKKRYIMCFPHRIEYYRSKSELSAPLGTMWLTPDFYVADSNARHLKNSKLFGFMLSDFDKTYYFAASDQAEKDFWMHSLACVIRRLQVEASYNDDRPVLMGKPLRRDSDADKELAARLEAYKKSIMSSSLDIEPPKENRKSKRKSARIKSAIRSSVRIAGIPPLDPLSEIAATNSNPDSATIPSKKKSSVIPNGELVSNIELEAMKQKILCEVMLEGIRRADAVVEDVEKKLEENGNALSITEKREIEEIKKQAIETKEFASQMLSESSAALAEAEEAKLVIDQTAAEEVILLAMENELEKLDNSKEDDDGLEIEHLEINDKVSDLRIDDALKSKTEVAAEEVLKKVEIEEAKRRKSAAETLALLSKTIVQEEELEIQVAAKKQSSAGLYDSLPSTSTMSSSAALPPNIPTLISNPSSTGSASTTKMESELQDLHRKRSELEFQARLFEEEAEKMHKLKIVAEKALHDVTNGKRTSTKIVAVNQEAGSSDVAKRLHQSMRLVSEAIFNQSILGGGGNSSNSNNPNNSATATTNQTTRGMTDTQQIIKYQNLIFIFKKYGAQEGDDYEMPFGLLFDSYSKDFGNIGPLLVQAKRDKVVEYKGDMLFRNYHGNVLVRLKRL